MEFLIRRRDDHDWPAIPKGRMSQVLTPSGLDCAVASGWGDHRLRCADTEIWFSGEPVGWQVSIEGPMPADVATRLVATVRPRSSGRSTSRSSGSGSADPQGTAPNYPRQKNALDLGLGSPITFGMAGIHSQRSPSSARAE